MAIYAIGDLQGCYDPFRRLLDAIEFDPNHDTLWLTGDLVNRGPNSLAVLRLVSGLGEAVVTVLGNHDLHLLALSERPKRSALRKRYSISYILDADDGPELIDWLRRRPLLHHDTKLNKVLVHAGILPRWSIDKACRRAAEVENALRGDGFHELMLHLYGNKPVLWRKSLEGIPRQRFIVNVFTRMRMLTSRGGLDLKTKGTPGSGGKFRHPWFELPHKRGDTEVIFGHWSALGYLRDHGVVGLDTGCVWGRALTALRVDVPDAAPVQVPCDAPTG
ncbi:MAG: symmetrical bis(5'-nucleosyl)-tetraphosphatase [Pseudomonadota bacterium]